MPVCIFPEATTTAHLTPQLDLWQSGNIYALKSHSWSYVISIAVSYDDLADNSYVGDLSFMDLVKRILKRKQTQVKLVWHLTPTPLRCDISLRRQSLDIYWRIHRQCLCAHNDQRLCSTPRRQVDIRC